MFDQPPASHEFVKSNMPTVPIPHEWPSQDDSDTKTRRDRKRPFRRRAANYNEWDERRVLRYATPHQSSLTSIARIQQRLERTEGMVTRLQTTKLAMQAADRGSKPRLVTQCKCHSSIWSLINSQNVNRPTTTAKSLEISEDQRARFLNWCSRCMFKYTFREEQPTLLHGTHSPKMGKAWIGVQARGEAQK